ncbi:MAG: hypothetical protein LQ344_006734 [Seirophora lacunosa]|nr:MAG: hypothetical protein LQ344_006734 [Seirophora lacunosa]
MSAARDEADAGPDILIEDATSATGDGRGAANLDDREAAVRNGPGTALINDNEEETSSSVAEDVEFDDYVQPTSHSMSHDAPGSADGSLSIPDDTPSLQVTPYYPPAVSTLMLTGTGFCDFLCQQTSAAIGTWQESNSIHSSIRPTIPSPSFSVTSKFSTCRLPRLSSSTFAHDFCQ